MGARLEQQRKPYDLLRELKERRILQNSFYYLIGAVGLLASIYEISDVNKIRTLFLIFCITGFPIALIFSYFHGKRGTNPVPVIEVILISVCVLTGGGFAAKTLTEPTPLTILVRMMPAQEDWLIENIISRFEEENHCRVIIKRFEKDYELYEIIKREANNAKPNNVSLIKVPLHLTLLLFRDGLVRSYEDILSDLKSGKYEIEAWLHQIKNQHDPVVLEMSTFCSITKKKVYFLPRKLETRLMIYRKSKVIDAVKNWHKLKDQINEILRTENGYGLPKNYYLEADPNKWDIYDLFVVGYHWAHTEYDDKTIPRIAHRSKNYFGTVIGLMDRALQLGAFEEDIVDMYRFSDAVIDMLHWEAIFRKYNLHCEGMWEGDGWSGSNIYEGIKRDSVYLAWMHQLDCLLIYGSQELGIKGYLNEKEDLGISIMPQGVSFELTNEGLPKRTGTRKAHTFGWFWGIPKNSPEPELAYKLAMFLTSYESQLKESENFCLISVKKRVRDALGANKEAGLQTEILTKSFEQLELNGYHVVPRFKTMSEYKEFLDHCYDAFEQIVIKRRYSLAGAEGKVDRDFIRKNIK